MINQGIATIAYEIIFDLCGEIASAIDTQSTHGLDHPLLLIC